MNKENCALKLVDEIILYYDARSKKHQREGKFHCCSAENFLSYLQFPYSITVFLNDAVSSSEHTNSNSSTQNKL